uniref:F-box domain-containing protein n=1 Tax=Panagrellus redivivus TaxID=6233 RepID=A0A7E4V3E6_PANRE
MPYPIATLPYPFRRRLRQLLSPNELVQLQIATGSMEDNKDLLPLKTYYSISSVRMQRVSDSYFRFRWSTSNQVIKDGLHLLSPKYLYLDNFTESDTSSRFFHHLWPSNVIELIINGSTITKDFLTKLSQKQLNPKILNINTCSDLLFTANDTKFSHFFKTFPLLETAVFQYFLTSGWVRHMLGYGKTHLKDLYIADKNFDRLFSFKSAELDEFVKAQHAGFKLHILYEGSAFNGDKNVASIESRVLPMFEQCFERTDRHDFSIFLGIMYENSPVFQHHFSLRV